MPFKKVAKNSFQAPSGKKYTAKQVKAYHAAAKETSKSIPMMKNMKAAKGC